MPILPDWLQNEATCSGWNWWVIVKGGRVRKYEKMHQERGGAIGNFRYIKIQHDNES